MAKRILPPQDYLREAFHYDVDTGLLTWRMRPLHHFKHAHAQAVWNATHPGKPYGSPDGRYLSGHINGQKAFAHRVIWKMQTAAEPEHLDHIDGEGANNRWINLRDATPAQNSWNKKGVQELPKGVRRARATGRFEARITVGGVGIHLGTHITKEEAHDAYCQAARKFFGEFWNPG